MEINNINSIQAWYCFTSRIILKDDYCQTFIQSEYEMLWRPAYSNELSKLVYGVSFSGMYSEQM